MPRQSLSPFFAALCLLVPLAKEADGQEATLRPRFYDRVAVVGVGLNECAAANAAPLRQAEADARKLAATLETRYGYGPAKLLIGPEATKKAIYAAIDEAGAQPADGLILYFACHGVSFTHAPLRETVPVRYGYLIPHDAELNLLNRNDPAEWAEKAIDMKELVDRLIGLKRIRHVVLIADTCCSGFMTKRGGLMSAEIIALLSEPSRTVLAATTKNELAVDGVFTPKLVDLLEQSYKDRDPQSVTDLFQKLRDAVPQTQKGMTPQMAVVGDGDGEFIFIPTTLSEAAGRKLKAAVEQAKATTKISHSELEPLKGVLDRKRQLAGRRTRLADVFMASNAIQTDYRYADDAAAEARKWEAIRQSFRDNAAWGDPLAIVGLHLCYQAGLGAPGRTPDREAAYQVALDAVAVEGPQAAGVGDYLLGRCYRNEIGVTRNARAAERLLRDSARKGFVLGKVALAELLMGRSPTGDDAALAKKCLDDGMAANAPAAHFLFAQALATGKVSGIPKDLVASVRSFGRSAELGYVPALYSTYGGYAGGFPGVADRDLDLAENCLRKGAAAGHAASQYALGSELYHHPRGATRFLKLQPDKAAGLVLIEQAAAQEYGPALGFLAALYLEGDKGVTGPDPKKAKRYLDAGVAVNWLPSVVMAGQLHLTGGSFVEQDDKKAFSLFQRAAEGGDPVGCERLGFMYEMGRGFGLEDRLRPKGAEYYVFTRNALHWYIMAMNNGGSKDADKRLTEFAGFLRLERRGIPYGRGAETEPSTVLDAWKQLFPETAAQFERDYMKAKP